MITFFVTTAHLAHEFAHLAGRHIWHLHGRWWAVRGLPGSIGHASHGKR